MNVDLTELDKSELKILVDVEVARLWERVRKLSNEGEDNSKMINTCIERQNYFQALIRRI